ncbi:P-loop containing nucleoside triphosphate hydrolase protein [Aspergillus cavernicola]|uniref:P-loop containing nucleoside triphosphate hydrolase protein n=1 Tax=Aspergillus cavernicola TaxID=176166 RepID=A0ABR4J4M0_9EURO
MATHDHSSRLANHADWYNFSMRVPEQALQGRNRVARTREGTRTLHAWQSYSNDVPCSFAMKGLNDGQFKEVHSTSNARFTFEIGGGMEFPHFCIILRLNHPTDSNKDLLIKRFWTASGMTGWDTSRPEIKPGDSPAASDIFTFSNCLHGVRVQELTLTAEDARKCMGVAGKPGLKIEWGHSQPPYAFGTDLPPGARNGFSQSQISSLQVFSGVCASEAQLRVVTRARATVWDNWKLMASMPVPTPGPFPLYDCKYTYDVTTMYGTWNRVRDLPSLSSQMVIAHHADRKVGWMNMPAPSSYMEPRKIMSMHCNPPLYFINERHYEVVKVGGLLREAEYKTQTYEGAWNGRYEYMLYPISTVHGVNVQSMDSYFYAVLRPLERSNIDNLIDGGGMPPEPGTPVQIAEETQASQAVQAGQPSTSTPRAPNRWFGIVITTTTLPNVQMEPNQICVRVKRPPSLQTGSVLVMRGKVIFGQPNPIFIGTRGAIRSAMYGNSGLGIPYRNKLKMLLLGRSNSLVKRFPPKQQPYYAPGQMYLNSIRQTVNTQQLLAIDKSLVRFTSHRDFVTLITGPPGTGKTTVSASIAKHFIQEKKKVLIVAGSNYGLDVITKRVVEGIPTMGVYRLETEYREDADEQLAPANPGPTPETDANFRNTRTQIQDAGISPADFELLRASINTRVERHNTISLGNHIIKRLEVANRLKSAWPTQTYPQTQERALIWTLITYQQLLAHAGQAFAQNVELPGSMEIQERRSSTTPKFPLTSHEALVRGYRRAWGDLQEFYLTEAKVVFCTASTASRRALRGFKPTVLIIEEASQIPESICLIPMIRYYPSLGRIVLSGDTAQLPPVITSDGHNEFLESEKLSLFERLLSSGIPDIMLLTQYRMHPDIANFVNTEFYMGRLINHPSATRGNAGTFGEKMAARYQCSKAASYFLSVEKSSVWKRRNGTSLFNPEYIVAVVNLVKYFTQEGIPGSAILVLTFYNEERIILQRAIHERLNQRGVEISNVDAVQGNENQIVIVSTTRLGGNNGLGFLTDKRRLCVALSRAKDGRVVVGNSRMGDGRSSHGFQMYKRLVQHHKERDTLITERGDSAILRQRLDIPNDEEYQCMGRA